MKDSNAADEIIFITALRTVDTDNTTNGNCVVRPFEKGALREERAIDEFQFRRGKDLQNCASEIDLAGPGARA